MIIAFALSMSVRPFNALMGRLERRSDATSQTRPCPECLSDIPVAARRGGHRTAEVGAAEDASSS